MRARRACGRIVRPLNSIVIRPPDMPSDNNKRLQQVLASTLKGCGFRKDGATWRKRYAESIGVINLQGSQWGPSFYVNVGIYFTGIGENDKPLEYQCHVRARLDGLVRDRNRLAQLLDFERPIADADRAAELEAVVLENAVPWLESVSTRKGAREFCASHDWKLVTGDARKYLALVPSV